MRKEYDVIVIGAGPAGIFACYELTRKAGGLNILLVDKGHDIYGRKCPILEKRISKCPQAGGRRDFDGKYPDRYSNIREYAACYPACSVTSGFGGAGAYSDGKFNITSEFGGWMQEYIDSDLLTELIEYVDSINLEHGATRVITDPTTPKVKEIELRGLAAGLKLLRAKVRHLGTEHNFEILRSIFEYLRTRVDMVYEKRAEDLIVEGDGRGGSAVRGVVINGEGVRARAVIAAPGRDGSSWLTQMCGKYGVEMTNNQVDIGVRVETGNEIMEEINDNLYEGKFIFLARTGKLCRTFCSNPSGHVVVENDSGTMLANGHSYGDPKLGSGNTNFAVLVSHTFADPFNQPNEYAHEVSRLANKLSCGSVLVQKYGDIMRGRRTNPSRLAKGFVKPTLREAVPGDLGLVFPYVTMKSIIEMIEALNHVTPGIASDHTLFYGVEAKFYSARPKLGGDFQTAVSGLYAGGDGAGLTRGLAQAGASGVWIARNILGSLK